MLSPKATKKILAQKILEIKMGDGSARRPAATPDVPRLVRGIQWIFKHPLDAANKSRHVGYKLSKTHAYSLMIWIYPSFQKS